MKTEPSDFTDQRRFHRHDLSIEIALREPGATHKTARLSSFSAGGCTTWGLTLDNPVGGVWVRLPGLESQFATVTRTSGQFAALAFRHPLHIAVAEAFVSARVESCGPDGWTERRIRQLLNQRSEQRYVPTAIDDEVEIGGAPAVLRDVSSGGARAQTGLRLRLGSVVGFKVGLTDVIPARVVRRQGSTVGLSLPRFSLCLSEAA